MRPMVMELSWCITVMGILLGFGIGMWVGSMYEFKRRKHPDAEKEGS